MVNCVPFLSVVNVIGRANEVLNELFKSPEGQVLLNRNAVKLWLEFSTCESSTEFKRSSLLFFFELSSSGKKRWCLEKGGLLLPQHRFLCAYQVVRWILQRVPPLFLFLSNLKEVPVQGSSISEYSESVFWFWGALGTSRSAGLTESAVMQTNSSCGAVVSIHHWIGETV